jgi:hypothetical protein
MATAEIANEEMVTRVETAIRRLKVLRDERKATAEKTRLTNKIEGMELILNDNRARFQNLRNADDVVTVAAMIEFVAAPEHAQAANLIQGYLMDYYEQV